MDCVKDCGCDNLSKIVGNCVEDCGCNKTLLSICR